mgnify:CR=1 FL=1
MKATIIETKIFYPQYCFDCHWPFVSDKRHCKCEKCNGENVINCYKETYAMAKVRYGLTD